MFRIIVSIIVKFVFDLALAEFFVWGCVLMRGQISASVNLVMKLILVIVLVSF